MLPKKESSVVLSSLMATIGGYSDKGVKVENQDAFSASSPSASEKMSKGVVATLADGVSSASKAKEAAQLAVTQFVRDYYSTPETWSTRKSAAKVLTSLNQWMYSQASGLHQDQPHWLSTFSAFIAKSATGYIFHVGDSRIAQFRDGQLENITNDHNRKQLNNVVLTRAMGADHRLQVDVHQVNLSVGDIYILTCDGVHEFVSAKQFEQLLVDVDQSTTTEQLEAVSQTIVDTALKNGSDDNVSCLLVYIAQLPAKRTEEVERFLLNKRILPALEVGMKLDGYQITKKLHESTRSHLYLVQDIESAEHLVLKVPSQNFVDDPIYLQGFIREAWLGERLNHPNIMKIKQGRVSGDYLYHFCEFIEGQTLSEWMHDNPKPTLSQVREIIKQVILALRTFQRLDVIHRDLKPENIMIDAHGKVTLIDYGSAYVASLSENIDSLLEEVPQGTLSYVAPETLIAMKTDHKSDLFSLGVVMYELLAGTLPFKPKTVHESLKADYDDWQYRTIRQYRPDLPVWVDFALNQATQPDPKSRLQAYSELEAAIEKPDVSAVEEYNNQPLLERNPVAFWQWVSFILFVLLIWSAAS